MIRVVAILVLMAFTSHKSTQEVEISFINDSGETFKKMTITTDGNSFEFFNICKGEKTKPVKVKDTYWFCQTVVVTQKDTVLFSGFCTVGETLIKDGKLIISYTIYPKRGEHRRLAVNEVTYSGSAKNVSFSKLRLEDD